MYSANVGNYRQERTDIKVYTENKLGVPRLSSRLYKILSHIYDSGEFSVYTDPDVFLPEGLEEKLIEELKESGKDIGVSKHPWGDCIYQEGADVIKLGKAKEKEVVEQLKRYKDLGIEEHSGLYYCGVLVRRHTPEQIKLNCMWWAEYCAGCERDQISFPVIFKPHVFKESLYQYKKWL